MMDFAQRWSLVLALGGVLSMVGCGGGDEGPTRHQLSGKVTYDGQPIPAGALTFIPDSSQGNSGPAGSTKIKDGQYDTGLDGLSHVGGPHTVRITALDGVASDEFPDGLPMFPPYEMKLDLPTELGTMDIEVPADASTPR